MQRAHGDTSMADKKNDGKMVDRGGVPTFIVEMLDLLVFCGVWRVSKKDGPSVRTYPKRGRQRVSYGGNQRLKRKELLSMR